MSWMSDETQSDLMDVLSNMEVLANIKAGDKLTIAPKPGYVPDPAHPVKTRTTKTHTLNIDQRYLQQVRRTFTSDSRAASIAFIKEVLKMVENISTIAYKQLHAPSVKGVDGSPANATAIAIEQPSIFAKSPSRVLSTIRTKLELSRKGISILKATYSGDTQFTIDVATDIILPINTMITGINTYLTRNA